jgi:hypothetical protein
MTPNPTEKTVLPIDPRRQNQKDTEASAPSAPVTADLGKRLQNVQELLFGDAQRLFENRLDQTDDRHADHAEETARRLSALNDLIDRRFTALREEVRAMDREQTEARRKLVSRLGDAIKDMSRDA